MATKTDVMLFGTFFAFSFFTKNYLIMATALGSLLMQKLFISY
jgi:hypothetical protein